MVEATGNVFGSSARYRAFTAVKYLTYILLCMNVYFFLDEELLALEHTFSGDLELGQIIQSFAATIDTAAWVILLLLFELETSILDDQRLKGGLKSTLHGVRGLCYIAIVYAFTGYCAELVTLYEVAPYPGVAPCSLIDKGYSMLVTIDEYLPLDAASCATMGPDLYRFEDFEIVSDGDTLAAVQRLGWVDVINSATWILVCLLLEVEVRLQLRGKLSDRIMETTKYMKYVLYSTLFLAAAYWGYFGDFLDFWDASLWLFAFIFIELNVFEWQFETTQAEALA